MKRYYLKAVSDKWQIAEQSNDNKESEWLDTRIVGIYKSFEEGLAKAETYSPLAYSEGPTTPKGYREGYDAMVDANVELQQDIYQKLIQRYQIQSSVLMGEDLNMASERLQSLDNEIDSSRRSIKDVQVRLKRDFDG